VIATAALLFALATGGEAPRPSNQERTVSIDVKDEDVHKILRSMQEQCAIRNLIIDPKVQGEGTFVLHSVPCRAAFDVVTETLSLKLVTYENNVVEVSPR